mmetsp:Transcript_33981/g.108020  ORF Transcript_33981/g.108020 Transcript_33981/m.108020 type:complete len:130 (+) Transcript_33981:73-462(+)
MADVPKLKGVPAARVTVDLGGWKETVLVHPEGGPQILQPDGSYAFGRQTEYYWVGGPSSFKPLLVKGKTWEKMTSTEKAVQIEIAAKKNAALRERLGNEFFTYAALPSRERIMAAKKELGMVPGSWGDY